jgi:hypothetical protein
VNNKKCHRKRCKTNSLAVYNHTNKDKFGACQIAAVDVRLADAGLLNRDEVSLRDIIRPLSRSDN